MRKATIVLLVIGIFLLVFQILGIIGNNGVPAGESLVYYVGYFIFGIAGAVLLIIGFAINKKPANLITVLCPFCGNIVQTVNPYPQGNPYFQGNPYAQAPVRCNTCGGVFLLK